MRRTFACLLALAASLAYAESKPLTLEDALAAADAPHPRMQQAQAELNLALAEQRIADSRNDATLNLEGALRSGKSTIVDDDWLSDNVARVSLRKTLLDFGRAGSESTAASHEVNARRLALMDTRDARRIDIMARFFDVLVADAQFAADNEYQAVFYVNWDDSKKRHELGQMNARDLAQREASYQDQREKQQRSQLNQRTTRHKLANAINQPGKLPAELVPPKLSDNDMPLPAFEELLDAALHANRKLQALNQQRDASAARLEAIRAGRSPTVELELAGGDYSRDAATRDRYSAGLIVNWPIYQGERVDARLAKQLAECDRVAAEADKFRLELAEDLLATLEEIQWLRGPARQAARVQIDYRDKTLERARAEYELEMRSTLGGSMAETQIANLRASRVEYRLAIALERLQALIGKPLGEFTSLEKK